MTGQAQCDDPARAYPGDRPSTTILLDDLDARTLGALIAFYEHRVFANAVLLGINPFDQFGVELGKEMAKAAERRAAAISMRRPTTLIERAFGVDLLPVMLSLSKRCHRLLPRKHGCLVDKLRAMTDD